ncbi:hypothetical protein FNL37_1772 [Methylovorus glucosotrophus]|uniref:phage adaptor protein n=1 Tax=Methylovorus glucosotrophus TaxID=266009 RepID=UPI00133135C2|nr:hypothetical protein [Methylovorus glucosotrophus]KAF0844328.1 hypothetical protein FNL37_1772 [Methylovorus glucosotrophus]
MALPLKRTLGSVRSDIQTRLGFGMAGQAGVVNSQLIDSMIRDAQEQLYPHVDWLELKSTEIRNTGADQQFYDYPIDCNVDRIISISVYWNGRWIPLREGINETDRGIASGNVPMKYERRDQLELWPVPPSADYQLRFEYIRVLAPLVVDTDRLSLPDGIVFLHALSNAKAHYRQPDAQTYASQLDALLIKVKQRYRGKTLWSKRDPVYGPYDNVTADQQV